MKNPFLSLWLSQANAWAGAMHGLWAAELQRQQTRMLHEMTRQMLHFWSGAWMIPSASTHAERKPSSSRR
ncbi:hypothetical protein [Benzoatithermus flavus]|uniref:Uncharacterized protein n=1 Tax=Benzoatithermus flavus TaxID=3108223 RepID=A0ABU8XMW0_9PROT